MRPLFYASVTNNVLNIHGLPFCHSCHSKFTPPYPCVCVCVYMTINIGVTTVTTE